MEGKGSRTTGTKPAPESLVRAFLQLDPASDPKIIRVMMYREERSDITSLPVFMYLFST